MFKKKRRNKESNKEDKEERQETKKENRRDTVTRKIVEEGNWRKKEIEKQERKNEDMLTVRMRSVEKREEKGNKKN